MLARLLLISVVFLAAAGCGGGGSVSQKDVQKQFAAIQSLAAEGALVADGAAEGRTTDVFVRVHTGYLDKAARKVEASCLQRRRAVRPSAIASGPRGWRRASRTSSPGWAMTPATVPARAASNTARARRRSRGAPRAMKKIFQIALGILAAIGAPDDIMPTVEQLVAEIDTATLQLCEIRVFPLKFSDATNMAQLINHVISSRQPPPRTKTRGQAADFFGGSWPPMPTRNPPRRSTAARSRNRPVLAVADPRTNSVVVNADKNLMDQIAPMIDQLDNNPAKQKKVFVYPLKYADPVQTAQILSDMFGDGTNTGNRTNTNNQQGLIGNRNTNNPHRARRAAARPAAACRRD